MIHLVKRPPPSLSGSQGAGSAGAEGQGSSSTWGAEGEGMGAGPGMTVQATQDVVILGNIPVSAHSDITQVTQVRCHMVEVGDAVRFVPSKIWILAL